MTKCDCCGQEVEQVYRAELRIARPASELARAIWDLWERHTNGSIDGWICGNCEYLLRIMASVGMFEMTHVQASVNDCSLAMWQ